MVIEFTPEQAWTWKDQEEAKEFSAGNYYYGYYGTGGNQE